MRFLCPRCTAALTPDPSARAVCERCGLHVDVAAAETSPGAPRLRALRDLCGQRIGAYVLDECIGAGGMGSVYRARAGGAVEDVAIKFLYPEMARDAELCARFEREAAALRSVSHPGIVRLHDVGAHEGVPYLVMEHVAGGHLGALLAQAPLPRARLLDIGLRIAEALSAAHDQGIVHRDLKPANILVHERGVKLVDFGVAAVADGDATLTHTDAILGTFNYMAPEQRLRAKSVDARADVFSLGVILYQLATATLPVGQFEPPSRINRELDRAFDSVLLTALAQRPERRFADARAFAVALRRAGASAPRRRLWLSAAGAAIVAAALAWWLSSTQPLVEPALQQAQALKEPQPPPPSVEPKEPAPLKSLEPLVPEPSPEPRQEATPPLDTSVGKAPPSRLGSAGTAKPGRKTRAGNASSSAADPSEDTSAKTSKRSLPSTR